ncbi:MAG: PIN domain-containing protein [Saprospiraceae bacterium]|nr:PIN domain-containing protein [Saprospiraceae bacterium]
MSARNMGKNDLWIAATAHATQATLLTTDMDFNHLDGVFFDLERIDIQQYL